MLDTNAFLRIFDGYTLTIDTGNRILSFDVSSTDVNNTLHRMQNCVNDKFVNSIPTQPSNIIREQSYTRF